MALSISCDGCGARLKIPEEQQGRRLKCPRCGTAVGTRENAITSAPGAKARPSLPPEPEEEDVDFEVVSREDGTRDEEETRAEDEEDRPRKKKKKKRRRKPEERVPSAADGWHWWALAALMLSALAALLIVLGGAKVINPLAMYTALFTVVMVPISLVLLIASMFLSSIIGGGIEFGDARIVIPKAIVLLFFIVPLYLLPFGFALAAPLWWGGLMYLFKIDLWECWLLVGVNTGLEYIASFFLLASIFPPSGG